jgi:tetratricopeptide (TPR) repeat protein
LRGRGLLLIAGVLLAAACSGGSSAPGSAYERGLAALAAGRARTAKTELLDASQADPGNARLRVALARAYLLLGDGDAAEAELARARSLHFPDADLHHLLAHAWLLQGDPDRALAEAAKAPPAHAAYGARIRGLAASALGDEDQAAAAFEQAVTLAPNDSQTWIDVARFRREAGELGGAIFAADRAVAVNPRNVEALTLRGELTRGQYGLAAAMSWFDKALEIDPKNVNALGERAATLADLGRMVDMLADTRAMLEVAPKNPTAFYLQAMLAARAGKFDLARTLYERTGGALDDQPAAMLLAGAIDYQTANVEGAVRRLQHLVSIQPDNIKARRLLAAAEWRMGDSDAVIATLRPIADRGDADPYALTLIARALQKKGDREAATAYLARASDPRRRAPAALLGEPLDDTQLAALRDEAGRKAGDAGVQVGLIRALLARGFGGEAVERARALEAAFPGTPDSHMLAGDALGLQGDYAGAARAYRAAANLAFTEPVAMRLIEALRNSGDSSGAAQVLELFLEQNPQNVPAQMLAANTLLQAGRLDEAIDLYEQLRGRLGNRDATLLNNLAWAYSQQGDYGRAIPYARRAWELDPRNPATADTLGWLLYKSGRDKARGLALIEQAGRGARTGG